MTTLDVLSGLLQVPRPNLPGLLGVEAALLESLSAELGALGEGLPEGGIERVLLPIGQARVELLTVASLVRLVHEKHRALQGRNLAEHLINPTVFSSVKDNAPETIRMLHELRTRAYGRVAILRDVKTDGLRVFRIAQANLGFPDIGVLNRLAPLAQRLVSAAVGDEIETPKATYEVVGVAHLERFFGNDLIVHEENFRRMDLQHARLSEPAVLDDLAAAVAQRLAEMKLAILQKGSLSQAEEPEARPVDRADTERLGAHFYTRTTKLQETLMQKASSGLVVVVGVAGSGKTSVALGRTKVLCDRLSEEEGEDEPGFFKPETAVGFVLNDQLRTYLEKTCTQLSLYDMKVREYRDLREELLRTRSLDAAGLERATSAPTHPAEATMAWVHALDAEVAIHFADSLPSAVERPPVERETARKQAAKRTDLQNAALEEIWSRFVGRIVEVAAWLRRPERADAALRVEGLAARIDTARDRFAKELEADAAWAGPANREIRQNVRGALRERLIRALRLTDAYSAALTSLTLSAAPGLPDGAASERVAAGRIAADQIKSGRLTDPAIDVLLVLAHAISIGYAGREERDPISHLAQPSFYSQVFIDEYQDFTEVQIHLMAGQADPRRRAVTMVGDTCQQLRAVRPINLSTCFPHSSGEELVPAVLLENKRQTPVLARLSQQFRDVVLKDPAGVGLRFGSTGVLPRLVRYAAPADLHDAIENEVTQLPPEYSVAVICLTAAMAKQLELELRDRLTSRFRETRFSTHADLVRRFFVHFTTPIDAKGLEFDAAIVPWGEPPDLSNPIVANGTYVAISRPRQRLSIIAPSGAVDALSWVPSDYVEAS